MPNTLVLTKRFRAGKYEVKATVKEGSDISPNIFIYEKDDKGGLADYVGIGFLQDIAKLKVYSPERKTNFGSRHCLYHEGLAKLDTPKAQDDMVHHMKATFKRLIDQFNDQSEDEVEEYEL